MIVIEHRSIELDYCTRCRGVWFDSGELELLLAQAKAEAPLARVQSEEKKRRCPECGRKMDKVRAGREPGVLLDACPQNEGLWFDGGELDTLIRQLSEGSAPEIGLFLGDVFRGKDSFERK